MMCFLSGKSHNHKLPLITSLLMLLVLVLFSSCVTQYHVQGVTDKSQLEGQMLYVRMFLRDEMVTIDSCRVVHGQVTFSGELDSAKFVALYKGDEFVGPLVLEEGEISMSLNDFKNEIKGGPFNDSLNVFLTRYQNFLRSRMILEDEYRNCQRLDAQLILDGVPEMERIKRTNEKINRILDKMGEIERAQDNFETDFVVDNSNNILGPGLFMLLTWKYPYPYLTPQIDEILFRSKPYLRNHPFVKSYIEAAEKNRQKVLGSE